MSTVTHAFSGYLVCITIVDWRTGMVSPAVAVGVFLKQLPCLLIYGDGLHSVDQLSAEPRGEDEYRTHSY